MLEIFWSIVGALVLVGFFFSLFYMMGLSHLIANLLEARDRKRMRKVELERSRANRIREERLLLETKERLANEIRERDERLLG